MATASRSNADARFREMWGFLWLAGATFLLLSLATFNPDDLAFFSSTPSARVQNLCGVAGARLAGAVRTFLGLAGYLIPLVVFVWASACFVGKPAPRRRSARFLGFLGFCVASSTLLSIPWIQDPVARVHRGGLIGLGAGDWLVRYCGVLGVVIVALTFAALSFLLATEMLLLPLLAVVGQGGWGGRRAPPRPRPAPPRAAPPPGPAAPPPPAPR